jgi:tetrapyrrole methylase family protein/MazG family protein
MITRGITVVGLGPGAPELLTRQAWDWLAGCGELYLRTRLHPTVAGLPADLLVRSFDDLYPQGVTYAVPGHPFVAEATCPEIVRRARQEGLPVRVIEGLSFLEPTFTALGIDPYPHLALVDALTLSAAHHPPFAPHAPVVVAQIYSKLVASEVKMTLLAVYPDQHPVRLVHAAGTAQEQVETLALYEIDRSPHLGLLTSLYLPPLPEGTAFEAFQEVVAHLRAPDGCPWDREQTHLSLRTHLLEETYEALEALDAGDMHGLCEEMGDLLLQIVLHAQIAYEEGEFNMADILQGIHAKIVRRHPHVFGDVKVDGVSGVLQNWEKLKADERRDNGQAETKGLLDGVPLALPALTQAQEIQDRAARVGFDWPEIAPVWDKVLEELEEVRQAPDDDSRAGELGDVLFAMVNLIRWYKVDAESVLRQTNLRFRTRFKFIENAARSQGRTVASLSFDEMDALWERAKDEG